MQIVEFQPKLLPSLTRLVNQQIADVPPGCGFEEAQVEQIVEQGGSLWDVHFPDEHQLASTRTACVLEKGEVVAAAQWLLPRNVKENCSILWLVAHPEHPFPLKTLLHLIDKQVESGGYAKITESRFSFGVGWFGIPVGWSHMITAMTNAGYRQTEQWVIMYGETGGHGSVTAPQPPNLHFHWNMKKPMLEWDLNVYDGEVLAGECQVWGVPPHLEACAGEWATVEYIEVQEAYQRRGLARRLMAEQMRFHHTRRGIKHFIAWTGYHNEPTIKLNESVGFVKGVELAVMEKVVSG
jgi:GNAT superfamily N-acetyltransferase